MRKVRKLPTPTEFKCHKLSHRLNKTRDSLAISQVINMSLKELKSNTRNRYNNTTYTTPATNLRLLQSLNLSGETGPQAEAEKLLQKQRRKL